jgi:hypothetical protein
MNHLSEEQLIDHYYGKAESSAAASKHLQACDDCARSYASLASDLGAIKPPSVPERSAAYGEEVWQAIRGTLPVYEPVKAKSHWNWLVLKPWSLAAAATACLLIAAAFFAGRQWEHRNSSIATHAVNADAGKQRVVLVVLGDHLDRSERLLVGLEHAEPSTEASLQAEARDILSANRLYRASLNQTDDPVLAAALDHLERVLVEVSNQPAGLSQTKLVELQKEMNTDGLLFEVRILRSRVQEDVDRNNAVAAKKGVSIL